MKISDFIDHLYTLKDENGDLEIEFQDGREYAIELDDLVSERYDLYWQLKETAEFVNHVRPDPKDYDRIKKFLL